MPTLLERLLNWPAVTRAVNFSKRVVLPGFDGVPLYDVAVFFIKGLMNRSVTSRAASIAYSFFLALFPAIIFFFTLIPYIPVRDFHNTLMDLIRDLLPQNVFQEISSTLDDIIRRQRGGLLSLGFILAVYFATNGISVIMAEFNNTYHAVENRSWLRRRLVSVLLVGIISFIIIISITLVTGGTIALNFLVTNGLLDSGWTYHLIQVAKWLVILAMMFFVISFIYYLGPARSNHFRFITAGSSLATFLMFILSIGFSFYVDNFSKYNILYGSIGTVMIVLLMIYFNAFILLIGFELNASIHGAGHALMKKQAGTLHA